MEAGAALVMYTFASTEKPSLVKYEPTSALAAPDSCLSSERYAAWKPIWVLGYTARGAPASHVSAQAERHLWLATVAKPRCAMASPMFSPSATNPPLLSNVTNTLVPAVIMSA